MFVITKAKYSTTWIDFEDERYQIRYLSLERMKELIKKHPDPIELDVALTDHVLVDWKGVYRTEADAKAKKILPCTKANKINLFAVSASRRFAIMLAARDPATFAPNKEEIEKN
jgi:hypothetical protein